MSLFRRLFGKRYHLQEEPSFGSWIVYERTWAWGSDEEVVRGKTKEEAISLFRKRQEWNRRRNEKFPIDENGNELAHHSLQGRDVLLRVAGE